MLELNEKNFEEWIRGEKPVLVDFWAQWCVYCRRIAPALEKLAQNREDVVIAKINVDDAPQVARQEGIEVIPTLVLYQGGRRLGSIRAPESKARIEEFLEEYLG